jgi:hypothetical protein
MSDERLALLAALDHLLAEPFMQPAIGDALEATPRNTLVQWDTSQLTRAVKLGEGYRKYVTDDLPKFPVMMQEAVGDLIDYQYALRVVDLVGHAYTKIDRSSATPSSIQASNASLELASQQIKKLVVLLHELGQESEAVALQTILANDASARLQLLNDALQSTQAYQILEDTDEARTDQRDRLILFAQGDEPAEYLANQLSALQTLSSQAQLIRAALPADTRNNAVLARWQGIAKEIELHNAKDPKGSIIKLERFINELARELDGPSCLATQRAH